MRRILLLAVAAALLAPAALAKSTFPDTIRAAERLAARGHRDRHGHDLLRRLASPPAPSTPATSAPGSGKTVIDPVAPAAPRPA